MKSDLAGIRKVISNVKYKGAEFIVDGDPMSMHVRITFKRIVPDSTTGVHEPQFKSIRISYEIMETMRIGLESYLLEKIRSLIYAVECHEAMENFYYKGNRIFDPHQR